MVSSFPKKGFLRFPRQTEGDCKGSPPIIAQLPPFAKHPGIVFSKEQIYDIVCKESYSGDYNIVMSHKQMIHSIFDYKQDRGEIPQYHMNFNWSGKQLQC